ncbi:MAG TPA: hypothetical protein VHN77_05345, partial [Phycisphaerales bacterium]|nr:hypothetical protein [Phycisphaerales bacterium]
DTAAWTAQDPSISVSVNGSVAVAYWDSARTQLRIAKLVGGSWTTETVATIPVAATGPAKLAYNRANRACLLYFNPSDRGFYFAPDPALLCDEIDFNGDGLFPDTQDITDFLVVFGGGECPTGAGLCGDIDFNNDGLFPDTTDIGSLLSVFSGGACL